MSITVASPSAVPQSITGFRNIWEALRATFGESFKNIADLDKWGTPDSPSWVGEDSRVQLSHLILNDGSPFVSCGGDVIMAFDYVSRIRRGGWYVVWDASEHDEWLWRRAQGATVSDLGGTCPRPVLRLAHWI